LLDCEQRTVASMQIAALRDARSWCDAAARGSKDDAPVLIENKGSHLKEGSLFLDVHAP
jgi:hypothetical protein